MNDLKDVLEQIAVRGTARGEAETWARSLGLRAQQRRTRQRRTLAAMALAGVGAIAVLGGVVSRDNRDGHVQSTVGRPTTTMVNASGEKIMITCTAWRGDEISAMEVDPLVVPSSQEITWPSGYGFRVEVYIDAEHGKLLRVTEFGPTPVAPMPGFPEGTLSSVSGGFRDESGRTGLSGVGDRFHIACADQFTRAEDPNAWPLPSTTVTTTR